MLDRRRPVYAQSKFAPSAKMLGITCDHRTMGIRRMEPTASTLLRNRFLSTKDCPRPGLIPWFLLRCGRFGATSPAFDAGGVVRVFWFVYPKVIVNARLSWTIPLKTLPAIPDHAHSLRLCHTIILRSLLEVLFASLTLSVAEASFCHCVRIAPISSNFETP